MTINYSEISMIKIGEYHNGETYVPSMLIYYKNGDAIYAQFDKEYYETEPFEGKDKICEHNDTDYYYDEGGANTSKCIKEVDALIMMCSKKEFIKEYNKA